MPSLDPNITAFLASTGVKMTGDGYAKFGPYTLFFARFTPSAAKSVLKDFNSHNRYRRDGRVLEYAKAIMEKDWEINGSMIVFDQNGQMLDGQHRLEAVATAKKAEIWPVIFGVPFAAFKTIDRGGERKLRDDLHTHGYPWASDRAQLAVLFYREMVGSLLGKPKDSADPLNPSTDLGLDIAHNDAETRDQITRGLNYVYGYGFQWAPKKLFSRPLAAFCFLRFEAQHQAAACEYMHRLITGEAPTGGASNGVTNAVRNRLLDICADKSSPAHRRALQLLTIVTGWNRFCSKGNDPVSKFDVPKLLDRSGALLLTQLPELKRPNRRVMYATQAWVTERYDLDAYLTSGVRRGELAYERSRERMGNVDGRSTRLHEILTSDEEDEDEGEGEE